MTPPGIASKSRLDAHWAWAALQVRPASSQMRALASPVRDEQRRLAQLGAAERAWLAGRWTTDQNACWELRFSSNGGEALSCVLVARTHGADRDAVVAEAAALRGRLAAAPDHVVAEPVLDDGDVHRILADETPQTVVEIRKRLRWAWFDRPGAQRRVEAVIAPLTAGATTWNAVWHALAGRPVPTTIAVHLEPWPVPARLTSHLAELTRLYAALAGGRRGNPIWDVGSPPDPFAREAAEHHSEAARRYTGHCFRLRLSIAAAGPLDPGFAELVAATTGGVVCPVSPAELPTAARNLATLDRSWLDQTYRQGAPAGALAEPTRVLSDTIDLDEALVTFRLPYEAPDRPPLFTSPPSTGSGPGRTTSKRVFVSYVRDDAEQVEVLVRALRAAGYDPWLDRHRLVPGMRWKPQIRAEILRSDYFVACFSPQYWKNQTFMNEELIIAVDALRQMRRDRLWFVPVMLEKCAIPDHAIGAGETIADSLHYADFSTDWDEGFGQLVSALGPSS
ncbi:TIR domain-containing protein [Amycolatopsis lexingtonensis]|uniref:toll/interleukin-1 receptor domain-containing protein n=1 Tax=Amycolatopsis lexingtonensis TaxID=218822 RepID=UPI003F6FB013